MPRLPFLLPRIARSGGRYQGCGVSRIKPRISGRFASNAPVKSAQTNPPKPDTSLSGRLKALSRKYGRAAIAVYLGISVVDFAVAFGLVHQLGAERIGDYEDQFFDVVKRYTGWHRETNTVQETAESMVETASDIAPNTNGPHEATGKKKAGLWTEAVIAYGIHKALFIFIRVPVTVAITPSIVKALIKRGWKIGPTVAATK